ncbi:MAG: ABC transporter substrate-binding protein [Parcubacteria group bacterium]
MAIIAVSAVLLIAIILYVGYLINTKTVQVAAYGGVWREGIVGQPVFINPIISSNEADHDISKLVFDDLEGLSESIKPDPFLKEWTIRLKEGLKWSDGEKITSDDVIFTFDTITDPESRSPISVSFDGASVQRISELEVKFTLPSSYVFFEETLKGMVVIPKHIFGSIPPANFSLSSYAREPVGSGPYKYKSYKKEKDGFISEYVLVANKNYHGKAPYIKEFTFKFYTDEGELIKAFNNGDIDGLPTSDPGLLSQISVIKNVHPIPSSRYYAVFLNSGLITQFRNLSLRKALSSSVPRDEIINDVFSGYAEPSFGPVQGSPEPGVTDTSLSGLEFRLTVPDIAPLSAMALRLKEAWEAKGAVVNISALRSADIQESIRNRDYEALLFGNILNVKDDLYSFWHSSKRFYPGLNLALFNNREADLIMEDIRSEADPETRSVLLQDLSSVITDNVGAVFTVFPDYLYVSSPRLKGFAADVAVTSSDRLDNAEEWYVNTNRKFK